MLLQLFAANDVNYDYFVWALHMR